MVTPSLYCFTDDAVDVWLFRWVYIIFCGGYCERITLLEMYRHYLILMHYRAPVIANQNVGNHYLSPIKNRHCGGLVDADVWNLS